MSGELWPGKDGGGTLDFLYVESQHMLLDHSTQIEDSPHTELLTSAAMRVAPNNPDVASVTLLIVPLSAPPSHTYIRSIIKEPLLLLPPSLTTIYS